jgi:hypothetical protein
VSSPSFVVDRGYAGDGSSSYLTTGGYTPGFGGVRATQNDNCLGVWIVTDDGSVGNDVGSGAHTIQSRDFGGRLNTRDMTTTSDTIAVANALGLSTVSRSSAAGYGRYRGATSLGDVTRASSTPLNYQTYIGARNNNGADNFSTRRIAAVFSGASLTASDVAAMNAALSTYLTAVGGA